MALTKVTRVSGDVHIQSLGLTINLEFEMREGLTSNNIAFHYNNDGVYVSGNFSEAKIQNYNVSGGVVTEDELSMIQAELRAVELEYFSDN